MSEATVSQQPDARFEFGANWSNFLSVVNEQRIDRAAESLLTALKMTTLRDKTFLDIGSGSGLFSLAARRLGARVHSFDYDHKSVACGNELRRRYRPDDPDWTIEQGSILDEDYVTSLGEFDIAYSFGVLHHTGSMWRALDIARRPIADGGRLFIAIYNDEGDRSKRWTRIKRRYNQLPSFLRVPYALAVMMPLELRAAASATLRLRPGEYLRTWTQYHNDRGMSRWHDLIDWVGGWPFEVAKPDQIFEFYDSRGFTLRGLRTRQNLGCNEFLFEHTKCG